VKDELLATFQRVGRFGPRKQQRQEQVSPAEEPVTKAPDDLDASDAGPLASGPGATTLVRAPLDGTIVDLAQVEDPAFARGMIGPGIAIAPTSTTIVSPLAGTVVLLFATKHAVAIMSPTGVEVLVHVGMDTVQLKGAGFEAHVTRGQEVQVGTPLITFDPAVIASAGHPLTTPVVVTNAKKFGAPVVVAEGQISAGNDLFTVA